MTLDDEQAVLEANQRFYAAFEALDLERMEAVWLRESYIACVHPGWTPLFGWGPVMESWQQIFASTLAMRIRLTDVRLHVIGTTAWVLATEHIESRQANGTSAGVVQATNLFERRGEEWFVVHHHGSPIVNPGQATATRLQ